MKHRAQYTKGIDNDKWEQSKTAANQILILSHHGLVMKRFKKFFQMFLKMKKKQFHAVQINENFLINTNIG